MIIIYLQVTNFNYYENESNNIDKLPLMILVYDDIEMHYHQLIYNNNTNYFNNNVKKFFRYNKNK